MASNSVMHKFLPISEIEWAGELIKQPVNARNMKNALRTISQLYHLPIKTTRILTPKERGVSKIVSTFSPKAIQLLKEQMEKHPENFVNGAMKKWF